MIAPRRGVSMKMPAVREKTLYHGSDDLDKKVKSSCKGANGSKRHFAQPSTGNLQKIGQKEVDSFK